MRRIGTLMIFAGVLIVLTLSWLIAAEFTTQEDVSGTTASEQAQTITLASLEGEIDRLSYDYDDETLSFEKVDDVWYYAPDHTVPIQTQLVTGMAEMFTDLCAYRSIEAVEGENYGFGDGAFTVAVSTDTGEELSLTFGGLNPSTSQVYARLNDDPTLYLLNQSLPELFDYRFLDILQPDSPPDIIASELERITISRDDRNLELFYTEEDLDTAYSTAFDWYIGRPYDTMTPADTKKAYQLFTDITSLYIYGCAAFRADGETLAEMGLDEPTAAITVEYTLDGEAQSSTLYVGDSNSDDRVYVRYDGSDMVLLADANLMETIIYASGSSLLPDAICLIEQETVESFTVTQDNAIHEYLHREESWLRDGETTDADLIDNFFAWLNDLTSIEDAPDTTPGEIYASIRFLRNTDHHDDMTLTFHRYDDQTLLVGFDDRIRLLVAAEDVDYLLSLLEGSYTGEDT